MEKELAPRPINVCRQERLKELLAEFGGPKRLAEKASSTDTHLIAISKGRRNLGDELATKLEEAAGKHFGWMDLMPGLTSSIPFASLSAYEATLIHCVRSGLSEEELTNVIAVISDGVAAKRDSENPRNGTHPTGLYFGLERRTNDGGARVPMGDNKWTVQNNVSEERTRKTDRGNHK